MAALSVQVVCDVGIVGLDRSVAHWVATHQVGWLRAACNGLTSVVAPVVDVAAVLVAAAWLAWRQRSRWPWRAVLPALVLMLVVVLALKYGIGRGGPRGQDHSRGYFPSGHTAAALVCGFLLRRLWPRIPVWSVVVLAVVVAAALVYPRNHWVSDVVAAAFVAMAVLGVAPEVKKVPPRQQL